MLEDDLNDLLDRLGGAARTDEARKMSLRRGAGIPAFAAGPWDAALALSFQARVTAKHWRALAEARRS